MRKLRLAIAPKRKVRKTELIWSNMCGANTENGEGAKWQEWARVRTSPCSELLSPAQCFELALWKLVGHQDGKFEGKPWRFFSFDHVLIPAQQWETTTSAIHSMMAAQWWRYGNHNWKPVKSLNTEMHLDRRTSLAESVACTHVCIFFYYTVIYASTHSKFASEYNFNNIMYHTICSNIHKIVAPGVPGGLSCNFQTWPQIITHCWWQSLSQEPHSKAIALSDWGASSLLPEPLKLPRLPLCVFRCLHLTSVTALCSTYLCRLEILGVTKALNL